VGGEDRGGQGEKDHHHGRSDRAAKVAVSQGIYPLEVVACWPHPLGQKAHETVVNFDARPSDIHKALVEMGLKPGNPRRRRRKGGHRAGGRIYLVIPDSTASLAPSSGKGDG